MSPNQSEPPASTRLVSLDILRGLTVAFMILVNSIWHFPVVYSPLQHAAWNGWTPTDLVFPSFLFFMGASIVFSTEARLMRGVPKANLLFHIVKRFAILLLLGLLVNGFPYFHLSTLRIYGVLQRIAVCYLIVCILYLWDSGISTLLISAIAILVGYWALMRFVPVPGFGVPGHDVALLDPRGNLVSWIDRQVFPGRLFEPGVSDPEGLLSDLPALATTLLGILTGIWLRAGKSMNVKCALMFVAGLVNIALGELWNISFPINKRLWTSSYVLFAAGVALVAWAMFYWLVEIKGWKKGWSTFCLVFGTNAITAYVLSELLGGATEQIPRSPRPSIDLSIYHHVFAWIQPPGIASLAYSISFVLVCWIPVMVLYRKNIFIKI